MEERETLKWCIFMAGGGGGGGKEGGGREGHQNDAYLWGVGKGGCGRKETSK